jgi:hypothetical protein
MGTCKMAFLLLLSQAFFMIKIIIKNTEDAESTSDIFYDYFNHKKYRLRESNPRL